MIPPAETRIPLLHDHHTHPLLYAAFMDGLDLGRFGDDTRPLAVARIRSHVGGDGWSIAYGWNSARYSLAKSDFDDLGPLAVLNLSLHGLVVNDAGLALFRAADPEIASGLSDQTWVERNLRRVLNVLAKDGSTAERLERFFKWMMVEHGVLDAEEMLLVGESEIELFDAVGLANRTRFWAPAAEFERLGEAARARVHGVKLFTDGALGGWTAALHEPYRGSDSRGLLLYRSDELEDAIRPHVEAGRPVAIHAIGDRAIEQVVSAVGRVGRVEGTVRIEHAQLISRKTALEARELGISLSMQPNFSDDSIHYADRLPEGYAQRNNPFRMLIDEAGYVPGHDLLFGSDGMPHGVREGLRQALFPPLPAQALTLDEFVAGYCVQAGRAPGAIDLRIDAEARTVEHRVVTTPIDAPL